MVKKETLTVQDVVEHLDISQLLTEPQLAELKKVISVVRFKKNQPIYEEGDVPEFMLCLLRGKVKIYKEGVGGRSQIVRVLKASEHFGYRAYFANQNYVTAAAAFEASTICRIPMRAIQRWMSENIQLALYFVRQLAVDLGVSDQRTVSLTQKHIRGRLAESLLFLRDSYGLEEDGATLSIYLSREDLASLSNMTTSNAIRTLSAFASEKLIAIDGRKIKLMDEESLKRISKNG
jgi:CRP-like cAMP-binding protein